MKYILIILFIGPFIFWFTTKSNDVNMVGLPKPKALQVPLKPQPETQPIEIKAGQIYICTSKDPFVEETQDSVMEIKQGYVKFMEPNGDIYSQKVEGFLYNHTLTSRTSIIDTK